MILALMALATSLPAQTADDQYLNVMALVERADTMNEKKQGDLGKAKYMEAARALQQIRARFPGWNTKTVSFRMNYLTEKINVLSQTNPPPAVVSVTGEKPPEVKAASGGAQVRVLSAGAEPRRVLRLQAKPGDKQAAKMTLKMEMDMGAGGAMKMPGVTSPLDVTIKSVAANGDITYEMVSGEAAVAEDANADPAMAAAMKDAIGGGGVTSTGTVSSRGLGRTGDVKLPPGASAQTRQTIQQMKDSLQNMSLPLPEEAVGPGAKWEFKQTLKSQGMTINQTATYELVSIEGDRLKVKTALTQTAPVQKIENPQMPGMKFDLTKMAGKGGGELTFDLDQILPVQAKSDVQTELSLSMNLGGQKQAMTMKMGMNLSLESK